MCSVFDHHLSQIKKETIIARLKRWFINLTLYEKHFYSLVNIIWYYGTVNL